MSELAVQGINAAVKGMYEAFPYPDYSLFIPLRWQEAYASGSLFAQGLVRQKLGHNLLGEGRKRILIAGCGDVQAAIISRWEPRSHRMVGVDLSRPSLRKAKLRALMMLRPMRLQQLNLEDPRVDLGEPYAHIDAYGMLHHLANPSEGLQTLSRCLLPGGTMRIMVYNSRARQWMFQISRVFALLGLKAYDRADLQESVRLLQSMQRNVPALQDRLDGMKGIIQEPARLVDAFFHEREARLGLSYWLKAIHKAGLIPLGLMDRYAELDDLANPLLRMPADDLLQARIDDLRFENNLEFYLYKDAPPPLSAGVHAAPLNLRRRLPPLAWQRYAETKSLGIGQLWPLWQAFLSRTFQGQSSFLDRWARRIEPLALQRLSRLGALFPDQFQSRELQKLLLNPMQSTMEAPQCPGARSLTDAPELRKQMEGILLRKKLPLARMQWIEERLKRAQSL
ncbi:MAG TPA: methyltransferase domain-containing protein [Oligoflexus sp.]|uniref:class I SAM-dependent methyltransferase n=1 Tax=Oligoflexus sp. TaxID=1971216 RepID=UPI002D80DE4B|nr:methyltransferase domain-containing protein [Oligoflexus sp.]HET9239756.1 methyltransferase domain-containing protein [Oligoflexus sp.]